MKGAYYASGIILIVLLSAFAAAYVSNWRVKEDEYAIKFRTKGASGTLSGLQGVIDFDTADLKSSHFDVTVAVNTIKTGIWLKNRHAKAADFLDAERYPTIRFASSAITPSKNGFVADGALTIKDVSKNVSIPFTFDHTGNEGVFRGNFELDRKDYNLEKNRVGETIQIELVVPVRKR
ncbi:YceI family protein [Parapedobacter sp. 2B3]|uniref:YceI family protein n=1 Tax=Parapedobacter sp. 2B3 TaxID=3342381 RepID=UPI0035B67EB8